MLWTPKFTYNANKTPLLLVGSQNSKLSFKKEKKKKLASSKCSIKPTVYNVQFCFLFAMAFGS